MADGKTISTKSFYGRTVITGIVEKTHITNPVVLEPASSDKESSDEEGELDLLPPSGSEFQTSEEETSESDFYMSTIEEDMSHQELDEQQTLVKKNFHCNDNSKYIPAGQVGDDKLFKVRPVVDSVLHKCWSIPQEEKQSIDEQIIPTKGCTSFKQYCPKKPHKWGIKVWARCGVSGLVYDFEVYSGKSNDREEMPELLMAGNVVHRLCDTLPHNMNHKIYFDNYFSSLPLLQYLTKKKIWVVATVRKDRMKGAQRYLQSEKELKRNGPGSSDSVVEANSGITIVRWMDNGIVQLISNYMSGEDGSAARRWCKKEREYVMIERPLIIHEYNIHMGGVDLRDMLLSLYRIGHTSVKYYMHIVFYCIGISIVNAWLFYRRHCGQMDIPKKKQLTLLKFQAKSGYSLANAGKIHKLKRGRPSKMHQKYHPNREEPLML